MPLADGLRLLMEHVDRLAMGRNGRALVERRFAQVAAQMKEVYEWVLGGGEEPGWVGRWWMVDGGVVRLTDET